MTEPVGQSPTCEVCGGGEAYWQHTLNNTDYHQFRATVRPPGDEAGLRAAERLINRAAIALSMVGGPSAHQVWQELLDWMDLRAALAAKPDQEEPGLDVAWAEAEAALPEGWRIVSLIDGRSTGWTAAAEPTPASKRNTGLRGGGTTWLGKGARGDTPAAALHALAARLANPHREEPADG